MHLVWKSLAVLFAPNVASIIVGFGALTLVRKSATWTETIWMGWVVMDLLKALWEVLKILKATAPYVISLVRSPLLRTALLCSLVAGGVSWVSHGSASGRHCVVHCADAVLGESAANSVGFEVLQPRSFDEFLAQYQWATSNCGFVKPYPWNETGLPVEFRSFPSPEQQFVECSSIAIGDSAVRQCDVQYTTAQLGCGGAKRCPGHEGDPSSHWAAVETPFGCTQNLPLTVAWRDRRSQNNWHPMIIAGCIGYDPVCQQRCFGSEASVSTEHPFLSLNRHLAVCVKQSWVYSQVAYYLGENVDWWMKAIVSVSALVAGVGYMVEAMRWRQMRRQ